MDTTDLDPLLLDPTRLSIVSLLAATHWAEFGWVRDAVTMSDSALSKEITNLTKHGYVEVEKGYVGKRPRTWLNLTDSGRRALQGHIEALQRIAAQSQQTGETYTPSSPKPDLPNRFAPTGTEHAVTNRVRQLEQKGWVTRDFTPNDRRSILVGLTPEGQKRALEVFAMKTDTEYQLLSPATQRRINDDLRKVLLTLES